MHRPGVRGGRGHRERKAVEGGGGREQGGKPQGTAREGAGRPGPLGVRGLGGSARAGGFSSLP